MSPTAQSSHLPALLPPQCSRVWPAPHVAQPLHVLCPPWSWYCGWAHSVCTAGTVFASHLWPFVRRAFAIAVVCWRLCLVLACLALPNGQALSVVIAPGRLRLPLRACSRTPVADGVVAAVAVGEVEVEFVVLLVLPLRGPVRTGKVAHGMPCALTVGCVGRFHGLVMRRVTSCAVSDRLHSPGLYLSGTCVRYSQPAQTRCGRQMRSVKRVAWCCCHSVLVHTRVASHTRSEVYVSLRVTQNSY